MNDPSSSILTTAANTFMREIHDRMPVILGRADEEEWLDPEVHEQGVLQRMPQRRLFEV